LADEAFDYALMRKRFIPPICPEVPFVRTLRTYCIEKLSRN